MTETGSLRYNDKVEADLLDVKDLVQEIYQCSEDLREHRFRDEVDNIKRLCEDLSKKIGCFDMFSYYGQ